MGISVQAATVLASNLSLTAMALPMKKAAAMKAMKPMKAKKTTTMKVMKAMKAKRVSVIAKGKMARAAVFRGTKEKTQGGMTKAKLIKTRAARSCPRLLQCAPRRPMLTAASRPG